MTARALTSWVRTARALVLVAVGACGGGDASPATDAGLGDAVVMDAAHVDAEPGACPLREETACQAELPAPTTAEAVSAFVDATAEPLRCDDTWDVGPLVRAFGDARVFMFGETHGSNEVGIVSGETFKTLGRRDLVNVVAMELPMDYDAEFQAYVDTGEGTPHVNLLFSSFAVNFFGHVLPHLAHSLTAAGHPIRIGLVDTPYGTVRSVAEIREIAASLTTLRDVLLDGLPEPIDAIDQALTPSYSTAAMAYADSVLDRLDTFCAELSEADCARLETMANAMWVAAGLRSRGVRDDEWVRRRESVIYDNLRAELTSDSDRMFVHMGAFHANRASASAGSRLALEWPRTQGRVVSVAVSYGEGSRTAYNGQILEDLPVVSSHVRDALAARTDDPLFVSTRRLGPSCEENPFRTIAQDLFGTTTSDTFDGYVHIRVLSPESMPQESAYPSVNVVSVEAPRDARRSRLEQLRDAVRGRVARSLRRSPMSP